MTNLPDPSAITDAITAIDVSTIDLASIDVPGAAVARRRTARLARGTARLGARGGSAGARAAFVGVRATGRGIGRGTVGTVRIARRHPRASAGVIALLLALIAGYAMSRRSSESSSDTHLDAVS